MLDFLRRHRDALWGIALGAVLLSIFFPLIQGFYVWISSDNLLDGDGSPPSVAFWMLSQYFFDPLVAAIALGLLIQQWRAVYVAVIGLALQLILLTGVIITDDQKLPQVGARGLSYFGDGISHFQGYLNAYIVSSLQWVWILGLIALGVAVGRKVGDLFTELGAEQ